jgi:hypothetical protein
MDSEYRENIRPADFSYFFRTLQSLVDLSEPDYRAYDFCRQYAMHDLATHHLTRFWTHTVISASHNEPAILHAMLALSGAHRGYVESQSGIDGRAPTDFVMPALAHYGKAVHQLQNRMTISSFENLQVVLITCVILLAFDIIHGRFREGSVHLSHGQQILRVLHSSASNKQSDDLYLPQETKSVLDELSYLFALIDLQSVNFTSTVPQLKLVDKLNADGDTPNPEELPHFSTFDDAWRSMLLLSNEVYHFSYPMANPLSDASRHDPALVVWQGRLLAKLKRWKDAFDSAPLRTAAFHTSSSSDSDYRSTSLRLNHAYLTTVVQIALSRGQEMVYDPLIPQFVKIIALCEELVTKLPVISLETGVIRPIFIVVCVCRHPHLRRRALRILSQAHKEAYWDSKKVEILLQEKMKLEEESAGYIYDQENPVPEDADLGEIIPESARWSEIRVTFPSDDYVVANLEFIRRMKKGTVGLITGDGEIEVREKLITLDSPCRE